jgi:hypothetical protein
VHTGRCDLMDATMRFATTKPKRSSKWICAGVWLWSSIALAAGDLPASTQDQMPAQTLEPIDVIGKVPERDSKPYRDLVKAMDVFEKHHAKAPEATIRFKVLPRHDPSDMQGLTLTIRGETVKQPIPIAEDGTFTLERNQLALSQAAIVVSNRPPKSLAWHADIRTPGIRSPTRRLGDLRLECQVDVDGTGAGLVPAIKPPAFWAIAAVTDACMIHGVSYEWFADEPVFGVRLLAGERRATLPSLYLWASAPNANPAVAAVPDSYWDGLDYLRDRLFTLPIFNETWPDDTLVEFELMHDEQKQMQDVP